MKSKICIICSENKVLTSYYKHAQMADGHLNKCKDCTKNHSKKRQERLSKNPKWVEKERERGRDKYHRLNYSEKQKESIEKYPWKGNNKYKGLRKWFECRFGKLDPMIELHHWSYKEENLRDVILMARSNHKKLHNHLFIDVEKRCYIVKETKEVLNTKEKHIEFIQKLDLF